MMNHASAAVDFSSIRETRFLRSGCLHEPAAKTEGRKLQRKFAVEMFTCGHSHSQVEKYLVLSGRLPVCELMTNSAQVGMKSSAEEFNISFILLFILLTQGKVA